MRRLNFEGRLANRPVLRLIFFEMHCLSSFAIICFGEYDLDDQCEVGLNLITTSYRALLNCLWESMRHLILFMEYVDIFYNRCFVGHSVLVKGNMQNDKEICWRLKILRVILGRWPKVKLNNHGGNSSDQEDFVLIWTIV
eukprot:Gb_40298 [translate_table: standard]